MKKFNVIVAIICLVIGMHSLFGQSPKKWKKEFVPIETKWSKEVNPAQPLPEYPRPQMVRDNWYNLNGIWNYAITAKDASAPNKYSAEILVPYPIESALSGVKRPLLPTENLWYTRKFIKPAINQGERLLLHFGAVDWQTKVYINHQLAGSHTGGYNNFTLDITALLKEKENEITVQVYDPTNEGVGPHGKQTLTPDNIYYTACSGIWQTVWMEKVPRQYIHNLKITPDIDSELINIVVDAPNGLSITVKVIVGGAVISSKEGKAGLNLAVPVAKPHLWSPETPFLYDLQVELSENGRIVDLVKSYFGMRKISLQKDGQGITRIFLNNRYVFNLGILDQGYWPEGVYTAPTDEAMQFDIGICKEMGFNMIRKHIKVEPARWYHYTDKMGILVWQDFVNPNQQLSAGAKAAFETQVNETMQQLYNSPSIITWVVFNEKWGQYDQKRITEWVKRKDQSRLVNGHSGELLYVNDQLRSESPDAYVSSDMTDVHSYPLPRNAPLINDKARVLGEFGGIGLSVEGHVWDDMQIGWGYKELNTFTKFRREYEQLIDSLVVLEREGLSGSVYTQPVDVESEQNGLLTYDRKKIKIPMTDLRQINAKLLRESTQSATSGFYVDNAQEASLNYTSLLEKYNEGEKDSLMLRQLSRALYKRKDTSLYKSVSKAYLNMVSDIENENNLKYLVKFALSNDDTCFKYIVKHERVLEKTKIGRDAIAVARGLIVMETRGAVTQKNSAMNVDSLERNIIQKYGKIAELPAWENIALHYYLLENVKKFVEIKNKIHLKYPDNTSVFDMNNDAWLVFQKSSDSNDLKSALNWSALVIEKEPTANYYDTYSNILYKLGRRSDAIRFEEKALTLPQGNGSLDDVKVALDKMRNGTPTW